MATRHHPEERFTVNRWVSLILIGLLLGCARYHPQPLEPPKVEAELRGRTLSDPGLRSFLEQNLPTKPPVWPLREWDLENLTLVAFYYHPDLDVARARVGVAEAGIVTAGGRPNPSVGFQPRFNVDAPASKSPWTFGLAFDLPIETAGKRGYRIARAQALTEAARLELAETGWKVRRGVRASLAEYLFAISELEPLRAEEGVRAEGVAVQGRRLALGFASRPEVDMAQAEVEAATASLSAAREAFEHARVLNAEEKIVSDRALQEAEARMRAEEARLKAATETVRLLKSSLTTPTGPTAPLPRTVRRGGEVVEIPSQPGEAVESGQALLRVARFDPMVARVFLPAGEGRVSPPETARIVPMGEEERSLRGERIALGATVDPQAQGQVLLFRVGTGGFAPGSSPGQALRPGSGWSPRERRRSFRRSSNHRFKSEKNESMSQEEIAVMSQKKGWGFRWQGWIGGMALVILGGLTTSTALNLLVLPTLALRYGRFEPPPAEREPAALARPETYSGLKFQNTQEK